MVKIQIPGLILFFAILLISDLSMAKKNWFITVNIGQHYNLNFIEEENISSRQIKKIFNPLPDQIFHAEYYRELTELLNKWQIH
ncbi:MAG: hypothetical protein JW833_00910, partial [Prolixibacteraceae bacterium]|nr:hypothetical protein [Prolixibacteraceae bacterium]